jgi:ubiquinone/menaquinone biosynthesis C-methylase UbiE
MKDFTSITELPDSLLNAEQQFRISQRYRLGATLAQGKDVLEVACGAGVGLGLLHQTARSVVGCDYTGQVLTIAQRHYGRRVPLARADAQQLPFADHSFDLVLTFEAIYYLERLDWFLAEAYRLLRSDGRLLLCTTNPEWPYFVPCQMSIHYPTLAELAAQFTAAGFAPFQFYGALPLPGVRLHKKILAQVRRYALQRNVFALDSALARRVKQAVYGRLHPLPAELSRLHTHTDAASTTLTPLVKAEPTVRYRVLFGVAHKP